MNKIAGIRGNFVNTLFIFVTATLFTFRSYEIIKL